MATQNGKSCEYITNAAKVKFNSVLTFSDNALSLQCNEICGASNTRVIGSFAEKRNQLHCS